MIKNFVLTLLFLSFNLLGEKSEFDATEAVKKMMSSMKSHTGKILKVFSYKNESGLFIAYKVMLDGNEIIVTDMFNSTPKKIGDEISFMSQTLEMKSLLNDNDSQRNGVVQFTATPEYNFNELIKKRSKSDKKFNKEITSFKLPKKEPDPTRYDRKIYLKLPLEGPKYHWRFTDKNKCLESTLTLIIKSPERVEQSVIFSEGTLSSDWEYMSCSESQTQMYFGFKSLKNFNIAATDTITIDFKINDDLKGIGSEMKATLKAGHYKSSGKCKIYNIKDKENFYCYITKDNWEKLWPMEKTSDKGWMEDNYNSKNRHLLTGDPNHYQLEIRISEKKNFTISVVNHQDKTFFYEHFRDQNDVITYLIENTKNLPQPIVIDLGYQSNKNESNEVLEKLKNELQAKEIVYVIESLNEKNYFDKDRRKANIEFIPEYKRL